MESGEGESRESAPQARFTFPPHATPAPSDAERELVYVPVATEGMYVFGAPRAASRSPAPAYCRALRSQGEGAVLTYDLTAEQAFDAKERVERILAALFGGDFTVACWEPGQISPYHCHPFAVESYFCFQGGGVMRTPAERVDIAPGSFVVHPPGELHEYINGPERTLLFRVRYGGDMATRTLSWDSMPDWRPGADDLDYFRGNPAPI